MFKVVLFDADGMVIVAVRFSEQMQTKYGIPWEAMEPFFEGPFQRCKTTQADLREELSKALPSWGWKGTVDELMDFWFRSASVTDPRMTELVQGLRRRGIRCYLATNQEPYRAAFLRTQMHFDTLFDGLFTSAEIGCMKNDPAFFDHVYKTVNTPDNPTQPSEILFADDRAENIEVAKTCGFQTHLYTGFEAFASLLPVAAAAAAA